MDAVQRLRASSSTASPWGAGNVNNEPDSGPSSPGGESVLGPGLKWFQKPQKKSRKQSHPYEVYAISVQQDGDHLREYQGVAFWPFVGPEKQLGEGQWDDMDGHLAIAAFDKLVIARCTKDNPYEELYDLNFVNEQLFRVAWSFDPYIRHPLIATAGQSGVIHIIDFKLRQVIRTFTGHGGEILFVKFAPHAPHILISGGEDRTVRLWNILGGDFIEPPNDKTSSHNYPQADADEGDASIAVLTGEGSGGHKATVCDAAFHPSHRALATAGSDFVVKIWALPAFPEPTPDPPAQTPAGHRPLLITHPLFSTDRIHTSALDCIFWISDDILVSRSPQETVFWKWTGYARYFRNGTFEAIGTNPQFHDYHESHSFHILNKFTDTIPFWWWSAALHCAFDPEDQESLHEHAVTDTLYAWPLNANPPTIRFVNVFNMEYDAPKSPFERLRSLTPNSDGETDPEKMYRAGSHRVPHIVHDSDSETESFKERKLVAKEKREKKDKEVKTERRISYKSSINRMALALNGGSEDDTSYPSSSEDDEQDGDYQAANTANTPASLAQEQRPAKRMKVNVVNPQTTVSDNNPQTPFSSMMTMDSPSTPLPDNDHGEPKSKTSQFNPSTVPWQLQVNNRDWVTVTGRTKFSPNLKARLKQKEGLIRSVAISPRGAEWIVGVGTGQTVIVWGLKDGK